MNESRYIQRKKENSPLSRNSMEHEVGMEQLHNRKKTAIQTDSYVDERVESEGTYANAKTASDFNSPRFIRLNDVLGLFKNRKKFKLDEDKRRRIKYHIDKLPKYNLK